MSSSGPLVTESNPFQHGAISPNCRSIYIYIYTYSVVAVACLVVFSISSPPTRRHSTMGIEQILCVTTHINKILFSQPKILNIQLTVLFLFYLSLPIILYIKPNQLLISHFILCLLSCTQLKVDEETFFY